MLSLTSRRTRTVIGLVLLAVLAIVLAASCSGSGNNSSPSANSHCFVDINAPTVSENVYVDISNPSGPVSQGQCQDLVTAATASANTYGVTASVAPSLPAGLVPQCNGSGSGFNYSVYSDGTSTGQTLAGSACTGMSQG